ncbi:hypothetical protein BDZ91DRAFT_768259 [Kalaharituber pfeilii]|nr:hypothetical protein BDZ91DRAFT_768259 [Kalaharituber pfeilii]
MAQQGSPQLRKPTGRDNLVNAVDAFSNLLLPDEKKELNQTEIPDDILALTKALKDARVSEKKINRCEAFLQSVHQFAGVVDTMIQHNASISALVWGSVKILLLTAQNFVRYFSALTELLEKLGKLCPIFKEFRDLWPHYEDLQDAVFEYYAQTVNFCTDALAFLRKSSVKMILKALLQPLHGVLQDVEKKLTFQQKIVDYQVTLARDDTLRRMRQQQVLFDNKWEEHRKAELQARARNTQSLGASAKIIHVLGNGCIKGVSTKNGFKPAALQYSGATEYPGNSESGKTFIGYFFCTFSDHRSLKFEEIIRSLIKQVLSVFHGSTKFEEDLAGFFEQCNNIPSTDLWQDLFIRTCGLPKHIYLILDGIDEFYVSSRKEVYLTRNLPYALSISLDDIKCRPEIEGYIDTSLKQHLDDGRLQIQDSAMIQEIKQALIVGVEGIQLNDEDIRETLRSLPRNLDWTYIRMLQRIVNDRNKDVAVEAFRWLTAARRPLSLRELVEAAVIRDDDTMQIQGLNRIPTDLDKVIETCGNFLMVAEPVCDSSNVRFIHSTVVTFLHTYQLPAQLEVFHIEPRTTEAHLAKRCLQYLHFRDIQTQLEPATVESISKPKQPSAVLAMPLSRWIPSEMQSGLVAAATRRTLKHPLASIAPKRANLKLFSPTSAAMGADTDPLMSQMHKSTLRDYIIGNWLNHCKVEPEIFGPSVDQKQYRTWFRNLALNSFNLVKLPWPSDSPADDPHYECFKWAAQNLHEGLVQLILHEVASDELRLGQSMSIKPQRCL